MPYSLIFMIGKHYSDQAYANLSLITQLVLLEKLALALHHRGLFRKAVCSGIPAFQCT